MLVNFEGYTFVEGGVVAAKGFRAAGVHSGIRKNKEKKDLSLLVAAGPVPTAAVYTQNKVKGAPIAVCQEHLKDGYAQAIIVNSGIANTCNADGLEKAEAMCGIVNHETDIPIEDILVASTGVIGQPLPLDPVRSGIFPLMAQLDDSPEAGLHFEEGIMTTDTRPKMVAVEFTMDGKVCRIGGCAKGSGMIHPNMATMLCFLTTDVAITPELLQIALKRVVDDTFNMVSVDGDTSTNDTCCIMASGDAGNRKIDSQEGDFVRFVNALYVVLMNLSRMIAADGEGATRLVECTVTGAKTKEQARVVAKSVICSSLMKAAIFGADANWGRALCAIGYAPVEVDVHKVDMSFASAAGVLPVCKDGAGVPFSEEIAKEILSQDEVKLLIELNAGHEQAVAWGCDLTYDYVRINGDYRS
jgi:glutamate N-acetyltransferase/amino-acid N-acetyltransferase